MQVVCEATQSTNLKIQVAALQNLVKILSLYYDYMEYYMGPALFAITMDAMKSSHDEIALQGIEFWSNVCDEEYELQILQQEVSPRSVFFVMKFFCSGTRTKSSTRTKQSLLCSWGVTLSRSCASSTFDHAGRIR